MRFFAIFVIFQLNIVMGAQNNTGSANLDTATFGGGCFWCLEAVFEKLQGVSNVVSGYAGGHVKQPTYKQVCNGNTGHAEVIQITFNPLQIRYEDLLDVFFSVHDPTTLNRQGADVGTQYRSVVFYHTLNQKKATNQYILKIKDGKVYSDPIVTEVIEMPEFYKAEAYHQDYFENNPNQPYCSIVVSPKVEKFKKKYKDWLSH